MGSYTGQAVFGGTTDPVTGSWTNATSLNATVVSSDITGYGVVAASFSISGSVTQGTAIFEVSDDGGTTWWPISGLQTGSNNQASSFVLTGSSGSFEFATGAYNLFRVRLNPVILGSGSVAVRLSAEAFPFTTAVAISGGTVTVVGGSASGPDAVGVSPTKNPVQAGGVDPNVKVREFQTDFQGVQQIGFGGASAGAFSRARTAQPTTIFAAKFQYDTQPILFQTSVSGTGTVAKTSNESSVTLATGGTASGAAAILQSKQYFPYEPGKSQLVFITGVMGALKTNVAQRVGYFDANDGVFFQQDGSNLSVVVRSSTSGSPVNTTINQSSWNIDKLDGTGSSGITLNMAVTQIFVIDLQWLGVGRVRFGFDINGNIVYCHQVLNANNGQTSPYMNTASLPIRWEITNTGTAGSTTSLKAICGTVISEGGQELPGVLQFAASNGSSTISVSTRRPILSIQVKTTFNGNTNRETIIPGQLSIFNDQSIYYEIIFNGTLTGASFSSVNTQSGMNVDTSATAISGGIMVNAGYIGTAKSSASSLLSSNPLLISAPFTLDYAGTTGDIITVVATSLNGNANVAASVDWIEVR